MAKEILGHIKCPHCGNTDATVHQAAGRNKSLYYRCYGGVNGDCGTVQISLEGGQHFIKSNMRPLNSVELSQAVEVAADDAAKSQEKAASKIKPSESKGNPKSKGLFGSFFEDEEH